MLLTDQWAQDWYCGNAPAALPRNGGNGMMAIGHGQPDGRRITYADGVPYTSQGFLPAKLVRFDDALKVPVLDEGACTGDGTDLGGPATDGGAAWHVTAEATNSAGAFCENFAEGLGERANRRRQSRRSVLEIGSQFGRCGHLGTQDVHLVRIHWQRGRRQSRAPERRRSTRLHRGVVHAAVRLRPLRVQDRSGGFAVEDGRTRDGAAGEFARAVAAAPNGGVAATDRPFAPWRCLRARVCCVRLCLAVPSARARRS